MDFEISLPKEAYDIAPIFITAPVSHSGTALLQRSLARSSNAICYGDNLFEEILSLLDWSISLIDEQKKRKDQADRELKSALDANPTVWMPDLAPPFNHHMSAIFSAIYNIPHAAALYAKECNKPVWGIIRSSVPAPLMTDLLSMFPNSKAIFVHRRPTDAAVEMLADNSLGSVKEMCNTWNHAMRGYLELKSDRILKVAFEEISAQPAEFATRLSEFCGVQGYPVDDRNSFKEAQTVRNSQLGDADLALIQAECVDMMSVYYPELG